MAQNGHFCPFFSVFLHFSSTIASFTHFMLKDVKHNHTVAFLRNWLALRILEFKKWPKMAVFGHFCYLNALLMHQELS
jgi:hypothetical protein